MTLIIILFIFYVIIGGCLMPTFTRGAYKQILADREAEGTYTLNYNRRQALSACKNLAIFRSITWPVSLPLQISIQKIYNDLEKEKQIEREKAETARILAEYNHDPVDEAFKQLEQDENKKKFDDANDFKKELEVIKKHLAQLPKQINPVAIAEANHKMDLGMRLDEKGIWDYPNDHQIRMRAMKDKMINDLSALPKNTIGQTKITCGDTVFYDSGTVPVTSGAYDEAYSYWDEDDHYHIRGGNAQILRTVKNINVSSDIGKKTARDILKRFNEIDKELEVLNKNLKLFQELAHESINDPDFETYLYEAHAVIDKIEDLTIEKEQLGAIKLIA